jgi:ATP-dependent 26S proteasome regulatory subunit
MNSKDLIEDECKNVNFEEYKSFDNIMIYLKELLMAPKLFSKYFGESNIDAPKGILLHGPPGCGKTLVILLVCVIYNFI